METVEPHINSNGILQWDSIVLIRQSYGKKEEGVGEVVQISDLAATPPDADIYATKMAVHCLSFRESKQFEQEFTDLGGSETCVRWVGWNAAVVLGWYKKVRFE